jgi:predicted DNA-binding helix-hairpin-helix protein
VQTPFENLPPTHPLREHRLYQASFLLRDYGWAVEDLAFLQDGNLRIDKDPKQAWAELHLRDAPVEVMTADRAQLLRVPGIGPRGANAILHARSQGRLTEIAHLRKLHIHAPEQAAPYILLAGHRPATQLSLF